MFWVSLIRLLKIFLLAVFSWYSMLLISDASAKMSSLVWRGILFDFIVLASSSYVSP